MSDVITGLDVQVFIGPVVAGSVDTVAEFVALDTGSAFVEVELVEKIGAYGDSSGSVKFTALKDGRVRKAKGARDAGTTELVVGYDYSDLGQAALRAAQKTHSKYAIKVVIPNRLAPAGKDQIDYFRATVLGDAKDVGNVETVMRQTFPLDIDSEIFTVAPTAT